MSNDEPHIDSSSEGDELLRFAPPTGDDEAGATRAGSNTSARVDPAAHFTPALDTPHAYSRTELLKYAPPGPRGSRKRSTTTINTPARSQPRRSPSPPPPRPLRPPRPRHPANPRARTTTKQPPRESSSRSGSSVPSSPSSPTWSASAAIPIPRLPSRSRTWRAHRHRQRRHPVTAAPHKTRTPCRPHGPRVLVPLGQSPSPVVWPQ